ncbi:MAG: NifU family protein [Actinomycetota bacterium]|nr:NifU family protein [Actinomycetota bacterium]
MTESMPETQEADAGRATAAGDGRAVDLEATEGRRAGGEEIGEGAGELAEPSDEDATALTLDELVARLEDLFGKLEDLDEPARGVVFEFLDGVDLLHREAVYRLGVALSDRVTELREDPAVAWLFDAYGVGIDERAAAEAALESIRPYIHSHGGDIEVLSVEAGVVHVRMSGACSGCTASAITLKQGVEDALQAGFPGFVGLTVEEDHAAPHPPPGATLLQIQPRPS